MSRLAVSEEATREARVGARRIQLGIWYSVCAGPAAWKLQLLANYALVPYACWHRAAYLNHAASLLTFLLAVSGAWLGYRAWQAAGRNERTDAGGLVGRSRFLAISGVLLSLYLALLILGQWLPAFLLDPCDGIG